MKQGLLIAMMLGTFVQLSAQQPDIAFRKYHLPNGLTILLLEDHSTPRVVVDVIYKVGGAQDPEGRSGMAHFFEHLMFKGSRHVPDGYHNRLLAEVGGSANAQTFPDRTIFTNTAPGNAFQRVLWLEADRMGWWLNSFDRSAFEAERKVILNERMQNTDNSPLAQVDEFTSMVYFPEGYPYRRPVSGFADDIRSVSFENAVAFYRKYYVPSNAILCIGGNFKTDQALKWILEYFGPIPGGAPTEATSSATAASIPASVTRIDTLLSVEDPRIDHPFITIKFPTVRRYDKDFAALECISRLFGGSQTAYLNTSLSKEIPGCSAIAYNYSLAFGGDFSVVANLPAGASLPAAKDAIFRSIRAFGDLPDKELENEIARFKKWVVFRKLFETENIEGKMFNLILYEIILGKPDFFSRELAAYEQLTTARVKAAFRHYILNGSCAVTLAEHSTTMADLRDFYNRREAARAATAGPRSAIGIDISSKISPQDGRPDSFDRRNYPPLDTARFNFRGGIRRWSRQFQNGITVIGDIDNSNSIVSIDVYRKNPGVSATDLTELAFILQSCASQHFSAARLARMIDDCGAYYYVAVDHNSIILQIKCLRKYLDTALVWLREKLLYPVVTDSVYDLARSRIHNGEIAKCKDIVDLAGAAFKSLGPDPAFGLPDTSMDHLIARLPKEKAAAILSSTDPRALEIVCYGQIAPDDLLTRCSFFSGLANKVSPDRATASLKSTSAAPGIYYFDVPSATQVAIRCGFDLPEPLCPDSDQYLLSFANYVFGGFFNSRLNSDLREKKGYTYRVYSYLKSNPGYRSWDIELSVPVAELSKALPEIIRQADSFSRYGLSADETAFLKTAFAFSDPVLNEFYYDKMKFLMLVGAGEMRQDIDQVQHALIDSLTTDQLNGVVRRLVDPSKFRIVLAGDGRRIAKSLQGLGTQTADQKARLDKYEFPIYIR
jgi:zinc protease